MEKYTEIEKFDEHSIERINHLPDPIPTELYEELFSKGVLRKEELKKGNFYYGTCRNASVAKWDGEKFIYIRYKFGTYFLEDINHLSDDNGYDLFVPIKEVELESKKSLEENFNRIK